MEQRSLSAHIRQRESSIELLKLIGLFLIVLSHAVQTLGDSNNYIPFTDYILDLSKPTTDPMVLLMIILRHSGVLGNMIFFVSSAWFLLDKKENNRQKWLLLFSEIFCVSVVCLLVTVFLRDGEVDTGLAVKSLFPTTFSLNWYMTCYLCFLLIFPSLNRIIASLDQRHHLRVCLIMFLLYFGFNFIVKGLYFMTNLVLWIAVFFLVSYAKKYNLSLIENKKLNIAILFLSLLCHLTLILANNLLELKISRLQGKMLFSNANTNPFLLISALCLFNILRTWSFHNRAINRFASLSMLIYLFHENIMVRTYFRPMYYQHIYVTYGYDHLLLWVCLFTCILFFGAALVAFLWQKTAEQLLRLVVNHIYSRLRKRFLSAENRIMKIG